MLQVAVQVFLGQMPVQANLFVPLVELAEILSHEEKLFARMPQHKGVTGFQVCKFISEETRHLVDHGAF